MLRSIVSRLLGFVGAICALAGTPIATPASARSADATILVSAMVPSTCSVGAREVAIGGASTALAVNCSSGTAYEVVVDNAVVVDSTAARTLQASKALLARASRGAAASTVSATATGAPDILPVYVPAAAIHAGTEGVVATLIY